MRAQITRLLDHLFLIDDAGESTCYLICGSERALLIDTVNGEEDLHAIVRTLTDLPVTVVNTHGHVDHIGGNAFFSEACMHADDFALAHEHFGMYRESYASRGLQECPLIPVETGHLFDLGGLTLEVVSLRGHTAGSIGLLDKADRLLFSGDGLNPHLWMQLDHSLPIAVLKQTILELKRDHGDQFDRILTGHARDFRSAALVDQLLAGCEELLLGRRENDQPYTFFGGECLQHPISDVPGECIVYTIDKL